jgi:hypothetical protein
MLLRPTPGRSPHTASLATHRSGEAVFLVVAAACGAVRREDLALLRRGHDKAVEVIRQGIGITKTPMRLPVEDRGRRADGHVRRFAIGLLISLLLVGCSVSTGAPPSRGKLTWAPLQCGDAEHRCRVLYLTNTGSHQTPMLNNNTDYRIYLPPNGPLVGGITITGGRRVEIIGGEIDLTYPCSSDGSGCIGIYIAKNSPGEVFVEGVWIHNAHRIWSTCPGGASSASQTCSTGDGVDVNTADDGAINVNTITMENIRVDGISGCSGYDDHADVFQPYQAPDDTIRIDGMTGVTNCQGLTLDPDLAYSKWHTFPSSITVQNANIETAVNPYSATKSGYAWWLTYKFSCKSGLLFLRNDYSREPRVWPDLANHNCAVQYSHGVRRAVRIVGSIRIGAPPGGDFVPLGAAGIDYRSPGYRL